MIRARPREAWDYLLHSREISNYTYELENEQEIAAWLSDALGADAGAISSYLEELQGDEQLLADLRAGLASNARRDDEPRLGKRRAQYCVARVERPQVIAESGVHDGLGSSVLLRALERNESEGSPGRLIGFDVNPDAGWLIDMECHRGRVELVYGDASLTLDRALARTGVDFFIHDSLRTLEHESFEYETAIRHRRGRLVLYTDDASLTGAMRDLGRREGIAPSIFTEVPKGHYWRGNELGVLVLNI